mmetsp:Transcript_29505/g.45273  ORF Transcript_29505/g.45273 Transcript_29505/m.45273 type:complete len:304 (-) Transcript_29505:1034-1945(-)
MDHSATDASRNLENVGLLRFASIDPDVIGANGPLHIAGTSSGRFRHTWSHIHLASSKGFQVDQHNVVVGAGSDNENFSAFVLDKGNIGNNGLARSASFEIHGHIANRGFRRFSILPRLHKTNVLASIISQQDNPFAIGRRNGIGTPSGSLLDVVVVYKYLVDGIEFDHSDRVGSRAFASRRTHTNLFLVALGRAGLHNDWFSGTSSTGRHVGVRRITGAADAGSKVKMLVDGRVGGVVPTVGIRNLVGGRDFLGRQVHLGDVTLVVGKAVSVGSHGRVNRHASVGTTRRVEANHGQIAAQRGR